MTDELRSPYTHGYEGNAIVAIFRDRRAFKDFVTGFVDVGGLEGTFDFERAELLDRTFVTDDLHKGERDIAWKVPSTEGEVYFVVLIEHQSTVDFEMPQRFFHHTDVIWQRLRAATPRQERRAKSYRLPPVIPVVFYTGERPWTGPRRLTDVIAFGEQLRPQLPDFELQIVEVGAFEDEKLAEKGNWARTIMHLIWAFITKPCREKFLEIVGEFDEYRQTPGLAAMKQILYHYGCAEGRPDVARRLEEILESEDEAMYRPELIGKRFWEVWAEEGREEGEAKGRAEAEARDLQEQIEAIREFFERRGLDWPTYEGDIRSLRSPREAARFLLDLATAAADMPAFLRERFGR